MVTIVTQAAAGLCTASDSWQVISIPDTFDICCITQVISLPILGANPNRNKEKVLILGLAFYFSRWLNLESILLRGFRDERYLLVSRLMHLSLQGKSARAHPHHRAHPNQALPYCMAILVFSTFPFRQFA